jgi:outer membrane protein OmpA-like peptidoglycan-associated protein
MSPRASLLAVATLPVLFASRAEAIPFERRLTLRLEANLGYVASPGNPYSAGFLGSARLGLQLFEPLALQVSVTEGVFPSRDVPTSLNTNWTGGLRFEPRTVRPFGRLFIDANAGLSVTGFDSRFGFDAGAGWEFEVSRGFFMGPVVRVSYISTVAIRGPAPQAPQDVTYISVGLAMTIQPWPAPRGRAGSLLAINYANMPDRDYDGVPDDFDQCPDTIEDHDGYQDEDGCPDLDDDADNLPDSEDRCPRGAETTNGYEDEDGCPDELPPGRLRIEWTGGEIRLRQRVYFPVNRVVIPPLFFPILTELASFLNEHPEIRQMRVEGHADDRGPRREGFSMSYRRAQAVLRFLVEHGVAESRLQAVGFGDLAPTDRAHDEVTRSRNRRIEFVVADGPSGAAPPPPAGVWTSETPATTELPAAPR